MTARKKTAPEPITKEDLALLMATLQDQKKPAQSPIFRAWSSFFNAVLNNPKTTLAAIGAAIPVLTQAVQEQNYVLGVSGLSMLMTGALAGDAKKPQPVDPPLIDNSVA